MPSRPDKRPLGVSIRCRACRRDGPPDDSLLLRCQDARVQYAGSASKECHGHVDGRVGASAAVAAFSEPDKYRNQFIPVYDQCMSCDEMVKVFTEVTGLKARCAVSGS